MAAKANWKPEGYHSVTPYLNVDGAEKCVEFMKRVFGAEELFRMPGGAPGKIGHCEVRINDSTIMVSDAEMNPHQPAALMVYVPDVDASFERAKSAGATVISPPADMFWGDRYARVTDAVGNRWGIATHIEDVPPEEMGRRAAEAARQMQQGK
jgi:PhnB protein